MGEHITDEHQRRIEFWEKRRAEAQLALDVSNAALRTCGVIYPLHLVEPPEPENVHQLKLAVPERDSVA